MKMKEGVYEIVYKVIFRQLWNLTYLTGGHVDNFSSLFKINIHRSKKTERTKSEMFAQFLKEVLDACQNAGLQVVATV
jgi:hypothetical protein